MEWPLGTREYCVRLLCMLLCMEAKRCARLLLLCYLRHCGFEYLYGTLQSPPTNWIEFRRIVSQVIIVILVYWSWWIDRHRFNRMTCSASSQRLASLLYDTTWHDMVWYDAMGWDWMRCDDIVIHSIDFITLYCNLALCCCCTVDREAWAEGLRKGYDMIWYDVIWDDMIRYDMDCGYNRTGRLNVTHSQRQWTLHR